MQIYILSSLDSKSDEATLFEDIRNSSCIQDIISTANPLLPSTGNIRFFSEQPALSGMGNDIQVVFEFNQIRPNDVAAFTRDITDAIAALTDYEVSSAIVDRSLLASAN